VFPLTQGIADEMKRVGGKNLGGANMSRTFRVKVAFLAAIHKLKIPVHSSFT
jgi:glycerol-3-phosphate acyltransferase PlsY